MSVLVKLIYRAWLSYRSSLLNPIRQQRTQRIHTWSMLPGSLGTMLPSGKAELPGSHQHLGSPAEPIPGSPVRARPNRLVLDTGCDWSVVTLGWKVLNEYNEFFCCQGGFAKGEEVHCRLVDANTCLRLSVTISRPTCRHSNDNNIINNNSNAWLVGC
jgi:hypothetical protein